MPTTVAAPTAVPLDTLTQDRDYSVAEAERAKWYLSLCHQQSKRKAAEKLDKHPKTKAAGDSGFVDEDDLATLQAHVASSPAVQAATTLSAERSTARSTPSAPRVFSELKSDRNYLEAEAELAAYRARREAVVAVLQDASGDRWDYANAAIELAAFRTKQPKNTTTTPPMFAVSTTSPNARTKSNSFQDQPHAVDFRDVYSAEAELAAFRSQKEAVAAVLRESNVDRWDYDSAAAELAQFRAGSATATATSPSNFSVDSRNFKDAAAELAQFRAGSAAAAAAAAITSTTAAASIIATSPSNFSVDSRNFKDAAAELAQFRAGSATAAAAITSTTTTAVAVTFATDDDSTGTTVSAPSKFSVDSRNFKDAAAELAAFRAKQVAVQDGNVDSLDRAYDDAAAELAAFRAKQVALQDGIVDSLDRAYDDAAAELAAYRLKSKNVSPALHRATSTATRTSKVAAAAGSVHGRETIDARDCHGAESELAAFRSLNRKRQNLPFK